MDVPTITSVMDLFVKAGISFAGLIILPIGAYAWYRTRSTYMILARLWSIFNGKQECKNLAIKDFLDTQSAILQFRFMTGIHARTLPHVHKMIDWAEKHDEAVADIAACGSYFDLEKPALKPEHQLPRRWTLLLCAMAVSALIFMIFASASLMLPDRAILRMKDTGTLFTLDAVTAQPITLHNSDAFRLKDCPASSDYAHPDFVESDIKHICAWADTPTTNAYVIHAIKGQRLVLLYFIGVLLFVLIPTWSLTRSMATARVMDKRLKQRTQDSE